MPDHFGVEGTDLAVSRAFYEAALAPLGILPVMEIEGVGTGFGEEIERGPKPFFWVDCRGRPPVSGAHMAFAATAPERVDAFHAAALAGGTDNGAPGRARSGGVEESSLLR